MKKEYDIFRTFQAGNNFDIYNHKPDRFLIGKIATIETEKAIYYCSIYDKEAAEKYLKRAAARAKSRLKK